VTEPDLHSPAVQEALGRYWRANLRIMVSLLFVWAVAGLGCGVLWADALNAFSFPGTGYPLGFWFAQQGSIIVFLACILAYGLLLNRLDARHHEELEAARKSAEV
jgi:putative solute:sodium symporter small subunit